MWGGGGGGAIILGGSICSQGPEIKYGQNYFKTFCIIISTYSMRVCACVCVCVRACVRART